VTKLHIPSPTPFTNSALVKILISEIKCGKDLKKKFILLRMEADQDTL
jgi:hypothetical protein